MKKPKPINRIKMMYEDEHEFNEDDIDDVLDTLMVKE